MNILASTYDKSGLDKFIRQFTERGARVYATGGTWSFLSENGIDAIELSEITGFSTRADGRVKTLHPDVFSAILSRGGDDFLFDMVVVNLYPFQKYADADLKDMVENIDIGGVALIRAAAKNFQRVTVVCDPADYERVAREYKEGGEIPYSTRAEMAVKAFSITASYDILIRESLDRALGTGNRDFLLVSSRLRQALRYGENPHQRGYLYHDGSGRGIPGAEQLQGKELSYNNIMDADAALSAVAEFQEPAAVIVKHGTPCGAATAGNLKDAFLRALDADRESAYGSIVALNREVDVDAARAMSELFMEVLVAPSYTEEALRLLSRKKNLRVLRCSVERESGVRVRSVMHGFLVQDAMDVEPQRLERVAGPEADQGTVSDLLFAWRVVAHCRSNAVVLAKDGATVAIGQGQTSRVEAVRIALSKAGERARGAVMASDAFFPFQDSIEIAAQHGVSAIIEPGGSIRDREVMEAAEKGGISLYFTGKRVFLH
ncbi:bifunctional purine biosynthesis protein PurH [Thermogymnomonas acidicola]|uniref:Bifunctional purine biosynthesis protein PurH n=1 Tax=Thermogymnomonas acidicola TaxID=399579 RepID=A0AA37F9B1_9ARCH|nr:bifunctional phosphoribosylaminoimidazolecarboxamide formyltransferase/IMP cyclohydrolase [Thermogymnomonas acidicola]GGM67869.1 bifunctional purine biosynthesis protein PurH [Thermogymnomonas acidicola]